MRTRNCLNGNALKLIAIAAMTVDHLTWVLLPGYSHRLPIILLHCFGRIAAPIMCYFIAEGYHYTHNRKKYAMRLLFFAVVSHFAYNFAFGIPFLPFQTGFLDQTSVIWALFWGLTALVLCNSENPKLTPWVKTVLMMLICLVSFPADWSCIAVLCVVNFGMNRGRFAKQMLGMMIFVSMYAVVYFLFIDKLYGVLQLAVALSVPLLKCYNGERGKWKGMKWFFYLYYPAHLVICGLLRVLLAA